MHARSTELPPLLIVDDDRDQSEIIQRILGNSSETMGLPQSIVSVTAGRECLERLKHERFSAVILDYCLPDMTGLEVLQQIVLAKHDTPVVIVTGQGDEAIAVQTMKEGAYDYVVKAGDYFKRLPALIIRVIEKHQLVSSLREIERATAQRHRELAVLNEISTAVNATLDVRDVCEHALEKMLEVMQLQIGGIYLIEEGGSRLRLKAHRCQSEPTSAEAGFLTPADDFVGTCFTSGENVIVNDFLTTDDLATDPLTPTLTGLQSLVCVPLKSKGKMQGVIVVGSNQPRQFGPEQLQLMDSIANQVSVALENASLFEKTRRQAEEIAAKNRELIEAQERLIEAERRAAVGQIGITVRHEINNPLTAILGQTQLLLMRRNDLPDDIKNRLRTIEQLSLRIRDIVKKLEAIKQTPVTEYLSGEYMIDLRNAT